MAQSWAGEAHTYIPDHALVGLWAGPKPTIDEIIRQEILAELIGMIICLNEAMQKAVIKPVNYTKLKEITQSPNENPALFHSPVVEVMRKYTNPDPEGTESRATFAKYFISQASPDIR